MRGRSNWGEGCWGVGKVDQLVQFRTQRKPWDVIGLFETKLAHLHLFVNSKKWGKR